ncbi:MAG: protein kinase, partial [Rubrobacteridae bacterium]|nr:protein kinase [Rubrobacteridae bacterium]
STETASAAIQAIINGLSEVSDISHRDLKPANILYHEGRWKIADFGIAKFVEDSTSMETLRNCLTPPYAAPEQWLGERPSTATDIYALGCIIYTLFMGQPPFIGSIDVIREGHLNTAPAPITNIPARFAGLVSHMLRKLPNARPTLERCRQVFLEFNVSENENEIGHPSLGEAARKVSEAEAKEEAERQAAEKLRRERDELFNTARSELLRIRDKLFNCIKDVSESAKSISSEKIVFGNAELGLSLPTKLEEYVADRKHGRRPLFRYSEWNVIGLSIIYVRRLDNKYVWSASLLFADRNDGNGYRWYEVAFWVSGRSNRYHPFGLDSEAEKIDLALSNRVTFEVNIAYGPTPVDGEDENMFISRWTGLVAKAAIRELVEPSEMPIRGFC